MCDDIKVSIITPCFNSEKTIEKTLLSVLNQTYSNYEYIIVDGLSNDKTLDIIESYRNKFDGKLTLISEKDYGIYDAMNKGIRLAKGVLIGIVNSDDHYEEDAIEKIVSAYTGADYEVVYGMQRIVDDYGMEKSVVLYNHNFLKDQMITHPTCFITKKAYDKFGVYSMDYKSSADYDYMLKLHDEKEVKFTPVYSIISNFCIGGMSSSTVAFRETLKLKLNRGLISKKQYGYLIFKTRIYDVLHRRDKKK